MKKVTFFVSLVVLGAAFAGDAAGQADKIVTVEDAARRALRDCARIEVV